MLHGSDQWGTVTTAILDRLLHHATTVNIKGESYRLKDKAQGWPAGQGESPINPETQGGNDHLTAKEMTP